MNTPTQMNRLSASSAGMVPSATLSATAMATACCAGPNICTACLAPLIVTLLNITVAGFVSRLGATTVSKDVKPSLLFTRAFANAVSAALPRGPMIRSIWATSLPSPTRDSPTQSPVIFAIAISSQGNLESVARVQKAGAPCIRLSLLTASGLTGPVSQIAAEFSPPPKSTTVRLRRQDANEVAREQSCDGEVRAGAGIEPALFQIGIPCEQIGKKIA